ncbi:MAG: hypothetical protein UY04_C0004G0002 [Parcubacteria group bacterium GW2011_GWA2_47_7]|nr:MAG: hypothetical protein UY04_C0004G0002 [Parcubacteria group bacterium GW2011_GWA2_47_7]
MTLYPLSITTMSLFGPSRTKGITKDELMFVRGELMSASFGHGAEKLSSYQVNELMEQLNIALDADSSGDIAHGWGQVNASEAAQIEANAANGRGIKYSAAQLEHIKRVFAKYIDIDKHKSLF